MRAVVVRVSHAALTADGENRGEMGKGLLVLLGIGGQDTRHEATYLAEKCAALRIFEDENGKMNKSLADVGGSMMVVSNFTLYADWSRGRRPDFFHAAKPDAAVPLYDFFISEILRLGVPCITGVFGADMQIDHVNDGPVTLIMDTDQMLNKQGGSKQ